MSYAFFPCRPLPHVHRALHNQGYPASVAAMIISAARIERDPIARHAIQIAWFNRRQLRKPASWLWRYR